jgi:hypothetical protein
VIVAAAALAAAAAWRFAPAPAAWAVAALPLVAAALIVMRTPARAPRELPWVALAAALITALRLGGDRFWPCELACAGAAHYRQLAGLDVLWPALAAYVGWAVAAWRRPGLGAALAWPLAGASGYFLALSAALDVRCPHCLAVHGSVLAAALLTLRAPPAWAWRGAFAALAFLGLHAAYHPRPVRDEAEPPPAQQPPAQRLEKSVAARADAARRLGDARAPVTVEVGLDLACPHCAEAWDALRAQLAPLRAAGRVQVIVRFVTRRASPGGRTGALWCLAAGARGQFEPALHALTGLPGDADDDVVAARLGQVMPAPPVLELAVAHLPELSPLLADDAARWRDLDLHGRTPRVAVTRAGRVRWAAEGGIDAAELDQALTAE